MELTGPDLAQELLIRLTEDLSGVLAVVATDRVAGDWKSLREATHVLISLSGSVGALSLQAMAEALNAAAHQQDQIAAEALLMPLTQELQALIAYVRATQATGRPAA
jgi:HPt (histidine-containing phosphotransfer) domain-containing protein